MTYKNSHIINKTRKHRKIHGKILEEKEGWVNIHIYENISTWIRPWIFII